ncbi:DUF2637 domain-containing protein [Catenulispora rubra]|uniref:DUF2637 domain-containing protein n=1 Tax=Catenulispora rubra TaxID=280293 RepID=UPI0018924D5F|nr:DUF2637 domain-containing protein [Catenulispora rubra]
MTTLVEHVNGHAPAAPVTSWPTPAPTPVVAEQHDRPAVKAIEGPLKTIVAAVSTAVGALGLLGFVNSFHRVDATAQPSFHGLAWTVPTGIDLGIFVFSALDIVLAILDMRIVWLRLIPWALTAVTIELNIANQTGQPPLTGFDKLAHGVLPAMWALSVEVGAHVVRKRARLTNAKRMDRVRVSRWLLAPVPTLSLWRRMVLWEERSYPAALARERTRVLAKTDLQDRYGRAWRFKASRRERALYRLGELAPTPIADTLTPTGSTPIAGSESTSTGGQESTSIPATESTSIRGEGSTSTRRARSASTRKTKTAAGSTPIRERDFAELLIEAEQVPTWRGKRSAERIRSELHIAPGTARKLAAELTVRDSATDPQVWGGPTPTDTDTTAEEVA